MKEQIVSLKTAELAKEKGFNESCINCYGFNKQLEDPNNLWFYSCEGGMQIDDWYFNHNTDSRCRYSAPSQSLLQRWLREEHNIIVMILPYKDFAADVNDSIMYMPIIYSVKDYKKFKTYEEALEEGLYQALNLIERDGVNE